VKPSPVRFLPLTHAPGAWQMAADEVLLDAASDGLATLRFYTWEEPTVSLGYFQPAADRLADPHLVPLSWVRRATGGAALVHDVEVTYALALPRAWLKRGESWLCKMHHIIADALADLGVRVRVCPEGEEKQLGPFLCFLHHTPGDLLLDGAKVVGSAQRKQKGGLVQHGGILLARSSHTPALPGIAELAGVRLSPEQVASAVGEHFARATGSPLQPDEWTDEEKERIRARIGSRYASAAWNEKR
jgi:lipoate-protein ligase A